MKKLFSRFFIIAFTIIAMFVLNVALVFGAIWVGQEILSTLFEGAAEWIRFTLSAIGWIIVIVTVLNIINRDMVPETKLPWMVVVIGLNVFGVAIYGVFSHNRPTRKQREKYRVLNEQTAPYRKRTYEKAQTEQLLGRWSGVSEALYDGASAPLYGDTQTEYFPSGEAFFEKFKEDIRAAKKFIFMEYFIVERGKMWNETVAILEEKVKEGVEVRVMYDDIGSVGKVGANYYKKLQKKGIRCEKFSPFVPIVTSAHNNRNHRKITVVDGVIGYTGGLNFADEYVNEKQPFGHWKDTAVRLYGEGVRAMTLLFLTDFSTRLKEGDDFTSYVESTQAQEGAKGYVQPYGAGPKPLYPRCVGEDVYLNLINEAKKSVCIMTPYLIIDYRLRESLLRAAERGVDVRIIVPHVPDKKIVFALTRSNYPVLIRGGVKIYEYTPGFLHAKCLIADGEAAACGTVNLDYRSFLHHYENGVVLYGTEAVRQMADDFENTVACSELQTEEGARRGVLGRVLCEIAKVFAPLF